MYVLDLRTGDTTRVSPGSGKTTCGFFQPGTDRVIFASTHGDSEAAAKQKAELEFRASGKERRYAWDYDDTFEIYSGKQDGTDRVNLTHSPGYDAEGSVSPNGKQIVFCSLRSAFPVEKFSPELRSQYEKDRSWFRDIYLMSVDGSNVHQLTDAPDYEGGPFFSPDGQRILWRHFEENGMNADIWTMETDGPDKRRVTEFKSMSWAPSFHPSSNYLIFTSSKFGFENFELFIVDASGEHEPVRVAFTNGFDGLPVFSPGKKLCSTSGRTSDGKAQLFLADWNDSVAQQAIAQAPVRGGGKDQAAAEFSPQITKADLQRDCRMARRREARWSDDGQRRGAGERQLAYRLLSECLCHRTVRPGSRRHPARRHDFLLGLLSWIPRRQFVEQASPIGRAEN